MHDVLAATADDTLVVLGCGTVGLAAIMMAKRWLAFMGEPRVFRARHPKGVPRAPRATLRMLYTRCV